ncbi:Isopentenyl-diphosphate Delta-isomerase [Porphyridium purpureum]|uniref:Isopentenyl-diphosphate Delta-isomerase n=1 Tax=Porphyridium purpureum TaxID=35688 RepID=A0A5J4YVX0_PORPP|nr:Isopentenyl-diphosphate Delta-isomerase [Porphyridium purpureum]|eukprot:POR9104..scf227_4
MLDVVDTDNVKIGVDTRRRVHTLGLWHRAVHILIARVVKVQAPGHGRGEDDQVQLLLQQRSADKSLAPLKWDLSCAEHLSCDEQYLQAAVRGVHEELGLNISETSLHVLEPVHAHSLRYPEVDMIDNEFVCCFGTLLRLDNEPRHDAVEVESIKWIPIEELHSQLSDCPDVFTPWFLYMLRKGIVSWDAHLQQLAYTVSTPQPCAQSS